MLLLCSHSDGLLEWFCCIYASAAKQGVHGSYILQKLHRPKEHMECLTSSKIVKRCPVQVQSAEDSKVSPKHGLVQAAQPGNMLQQRLL